MNHFIVFDFETDGTDPKICSPVQLAAIVIDPLNLEVIENSKFCSYMKPERKIVDDDSVCKTVTIDDEEYMTDKIKDTIQWHAKNQKCSYEEVIQKWKCAPSTEIVWKNFVQYVQKYNPKKTQSDAPIPAGMNIKNFDLIIANRLNEKYKVTKLFNHECSDIRDWAFHALMWDRDLRSRSMDSLRNYLGLSGENAHDALKDVIDSAAIISRYLKFYKNTFVRNKYRGCMANK